MGSDPETQDEIIERLRQELKEANAAIRWMYYCDTETLLALDGAIEYDEHEAAIQRALEDTGE